MKPARLLLALALLSPLAVAAELPSIDTAYPTGQTAPADAGVVIGITNYLHDDIPDVPYADRDARAFYDFLVSTRGVSMDRTRLIQGGSAGKIRSAIVALGQSVHSGGVAWVYFAGHGSGALAGGARMLLGDTVANDPETFDSESVPVAEIERLAGAGGGRVVIVVDACYTGVAGRGIVPGGYLTARPEQNVVWTAATGGQVSGPLESVQHGAFTYFALGALRGWADGSINGTRDGSVTIDEAQLYVQRTLMAAQITTQTPEVVGAHDLVLATRAREVAPVITVGRAPVAVVPVVVPRTGDAVVDAGTNFQSQLAAAKQAAAAEAEKQFLATEAAKQRLAKLDAAEATLRKQATADWASAKSLVDAGGAGAKAAADAFVAAYGTAKVRVDSEERSVGIAEVATAQKVAVSAAAQVQALANPRLAALALASPTASAGSDFASPTLGTMKWIPAGTFTMGSTRGSDETPHQVTLTKGYWLMEHEVTQGEYQAVLGKNPSRFTVCGVNCPVETVSWNDAVAFAKAASARDGVTYRLPTEAEWEYAARGGQSFSYAGSEELGAVAWAGGTGGLTTHPVCGKQRNAYGLCDMSGNVWEWVADLYGTYPGAVTDPVGASSGSDRVLRGGGWSNTENYATVAYRNTDTPAYANASIGFRLSRSSP